MTQIINITSEALQATIRRLLPSQQGFGEDIQASNVITPIIDLTPTAEGSVVRQDLQTALAFGSQTAFDVGGATTTLANSPGFWRVNGVSSMRATGSTGLNSIRLSDGTTTKKIWEHVMFAGSTDAADSKTFDLTFYLDVGENISVSSNSGDAQLVGSYRQIADTNGQLINPSGFNPQ